MEEASEAMRPVEPAADIAMLRTDSILDNCEAAEALGPDGTLVTGTAERTGSTLEPLATDTEAEADGMLEPLKTGTDNTIGSALDTLTAGAEDEVGRALDPMTGAEVKIGSSLELRT